MAIIQTNLDVSDIFTDVKTAVWAFTKTLDEANVRKTPWKRKLPLACKMIGKMRGGNEEEEKERLPSTRRITPREDERRKRGGGKGEATVDPLYHASCVTATMKSRHNG